jgi:hypothetical protein
MTAVRPRNPFSGRAAPDLRCVEPDASSISFMQVNLMSNRMAVRTRSDSLSSHILPVSGTMIGVCTTLIGLVKFATARHGTSHVDEYAALVAVMFLASALTSYLSIRWSDRAQFSIRIERLADAIFLFGLVGITLVATLFAYEVI